MNNKTKHFASGSSRNDTNEQLQTLHITKNGMTLHRPLILTNRSQTRAQDLFKYHLQGISKSTLTFSSRTIPIFSPHQLTPFCTFSSNSNPLVTLIVNQTQKPLTIFESNTSDVEYFLFSSENLTALQNVPHYLRERF